jgi:hypothetical protein
LRASRVVDELTDRGAAQLERVDLLGRLFILELHTHGMNPPPNNASPTLQIALGDREVKRSKRNDSERQFQPGARRRQLLDKTLDSYGAIREFGVSPQTDLFTRVAALIRRRLDGNLCADSGFHGSAIPCVAKRLSASPDPYQLKADKD